jgi:trimeric autotransporter adhesin
MKKIYSLFLGAIIMLLCSYNSYGQVSVSASSGTTGPTTYTTLKAAFDAINAGTHKGSISIAITGNTTETATAQLNLSATPSSYTSVTISTTGSFTISGALAGPVIGLNGASNVTIDGNNTLQIVNTNTSGNVISFVNDASNNTVRNTTLKGATSALNSTTFFPTSGIVSFGAGTTNGNDNNTIDKCDIDGTGAAACAIFSSGSTATPTIENSLNTISNCKIHDYRNATTSIGLFFNQGNSLWTVENNSFYHSSAYSSTNQVIVRGILIFPSYTNDAHLISGNYIGGNAPNAGGTMSLTSTNAVGFIGIDVETGGGNLIENNVIKNVTLTYGTSAGSFSNSGIFGFIGGYNGLSVITGNTVSDINLTNSLGFISFSAIHVNGRASTADSTVKPTFSLTNNTINNITANSGGTAGVVQIHGMRLETSSSGGGLPATAIANPLFNVVHNTISNMSVPYAGPSTFIRGIGTIASQGTTNGTSTASLFPRLVIDSNTIKTFSTASGLASYASPALVGIHFGGTGGPNLNAVDVQRIRNNSISDFNATNVDSATVVAGILASTGMHEISRNKIFDLRNSAVASSVSDRPGIVGITMRNVTGASTYANNFISLGTNVTANEQIFGIMHNFAGATGPINVYYNTVVITGAGNAGNTRTTAALLRGTELLANTVTTPMVIKDNILYNTRTGGGSHYAIANTYITPAVAFTSDYNDLYSANAATLGLWGTTSADFATWKTLSAQDANSKNVTVSFVDVAAGNLHLTGASTTDVNLNGTPITGITTDIDGETRNATTPKMGADEPLTCTAPAITTQPAAQTVCADANASFSVVATGNTLSYQWRKGGVAIPGANSATFTISGVSATDAGNYDVVITNPCGTVTSSPAVALTVNPLTVINTAPVGQTICALQTATFSVSATGSGTLTYQWKKGTTNIAGATSATYSIVNAQTSDAGQYSVTVTSATCGSVTSNPVTLTVNACTAVPALTADVTSAVLMPSVVNNNTRLRIVVKKAMKLDWTVTDATGKVVMKFSKQANAGLNEFQLSLEKLSPGTYQVVGTSNTGRIATLRFIKQ